MRHVLLAVAGLIAAAAVAAPAAAQGGTAAAGFTGFSGVTVHHGGHFRGGFPRAIDGRRDGRRHRGSDDGFLVYDREYEGDTLWRAESYNDWWHERPWRAYPAWVTRNQSCERQYWSGGGWTC